MNLLVSEMTYNLVVEPQLPNNEIWFNSTSQEIIYWFNPQETYEKEYKITLEVQLADNPDVSQVLEWQLQVKGCNESDYNRLQCYVYTNLQ